MPENNYSPSSVTETPNDVEDVFEEKTLEEIKKKSVSGAVSYLLRTIVLNAIGIVTAFILSGYLSPSDFGIYGYVTQFVGLFVFFSDIGLAAALVQKKTEPTDSDYKTAFTVQQALSWLIFVGFLVLSWSGIVQQKTGPVGTGLLIALGLSFPLSSLKTIPSIILERRLDFNKIVMPHILEQLVYNGVLIFMALRGVGVGAYAYAIMARSIIGVISMFVIQPWSVGIEWNKDSLKTLLSFGAKFQLNDLLARVKDQLFYIVLARYLPLSEFGYIQWAKNWSMYPYNLTVQNVMSITFPTFSRLQKNKEALGKAIDKSIFFITGAIFPILVGMSIFIIPLVKLVEKYHKWEPAILSLILFSLGIAWSAISTPLTNTLMAIGKINITLKLMIAWTVMTWILTPVMMYFFGFNGVAVAAFMIAFTSIWPIYEVKKLVAIKVWENTWRQLLASIAMAVVGVLGLQWWSQSYALMALGAMITGGMYVLVFMGVGYQKLVAEVNSLRRKKE
jgi:O-antigen/teichoic acid export membrane protein